MSRIWLWVGFLSLGLGGCASLTDQVRTNAPEFSSFVGQEFTTKQDLVVLSEDKNGRDLMLDSFGDGDWTPTREGMKGTFPFKYGFGYIQGILPAGSRIRGVRVIERRYFEGVHLEPYGVVVGERQTGFQGAKLNVMWLMDRSRDSVEWKSYVVHEK